MRIEYNTSAFGSNIVANNKIIITKGTPFNSVTYIDPDANAIDQTSSVIGVPFGTDFAQATLNRTLVTTTTKQLIHIKIEIQNCGQSVNIDFTDQTFTPMFSFYATTASAPITSTLSYDETFYQNPLNNVLCQVLINDFTSPVNGGVGDILDVSGSGFGASRGNGQVKFKNVDDGGSTYFQKLDNIDYISWSDNLIKIRMPSRIDTISSLKINTPGTGNFIVKNSLGDSATSSFNAFGQPFKVYYPIHNLKQGNVKYQAYVRNINGTGGYTIRLDTSMSNHPERMMCLRKAIKTWKCFTAINWVLGNDTIVNTFINDAVSTIFFSNSLSSPAFIGETRRNRNFCTGSSLASILSFDIGLKTTANFFYDITGIAIPTAGKIDFYEVILHELGHALGLEHIIDTTQVMYYATQSFGNSRRDLQPFSADVEAGSDQVASSITNINSPLCGYVDMDPATGSSCSIIGINELLKNNFYIMAYPNPTTGGQLNISFDAPKNRNVQIAIYDIVGKEIYKEYANNRQEVHYTQSIDVSNLSSGLYFVNLIIDKNKVSAKFIKN